MIDVTFEEHEMSDRYVLCMYRGDEQLKCYSQPKREGYEWNKEEVEEGKRILRYWLSVRERGLLAK